MNTNRITNKNLKRIAIAAGTTAAALFLSAGLVACDSKSSDTIAEPAPAAELVDVLGSVAAEIAPTVEVAEAIREEIAPVVESATKSVAKPAVKSTKSSKKKSAAVGGTVILDGPAISESAPSVANTVAQAAQQGDSTAVTTPAEQPATQQPAAQSQPAVSGDGVAAQQPASEQPAAQQQPATTTNSTSVTLPKISGTPTLNSQLSGKNLADLTAPSISVPCLPGFNC